MMSEHGFYDGFYSRIVSRTSDEGGMMDLVRITSSQIMKPRSPEPKIRLSNTRKLFTIFLSLFLMDTLVLVTEIIRFKVRKKLKLGNKK